MKYGDRNELLEALKIVAEGKTEAEYVDDFKAQYTAMVEVHLEALAKAGKAIDAKVVDFFAKEGGQTVAEQDAFSLKFQTKIERQIKIWDNTNQLLSEDFASLYTEYEKYVKGFLLDEASKEVIADLDSDIQSHADEAKAYGESWTQQIDNAGIKITNNMTRNTIDWFRGVTKAELIKIYKANR